MALEHDGINGEEYGAGVWQAHEDGLMRGSVTAGFEQGQAGEEFRVAIDEAVAQRGMIPVGASGSKTGMAGASQGVVFALNDEFGFGEGIVIADMVDVEMRAD